MSGWLHKDSHLSWRWTHLNTTSSFMIGRCRTCQARESTERRHGLPSGPRPSTFGTTARCLAPRLQPGRTAALSTPATTASAAQTCTGSTPQLPSGCLYRLSSVPGAAQPSSTMTGLVWSKARAIGASGVSCRGRLNSEKNRSGLRRGPIRRPGTLNLTRGGRPGLRPRTASAAAASRH